MLMTGMAIVMTIVATYLQVSAISASTLHGQAIIASVCQFFQCIPMKLGIPTSRC
jgi:hypothetical protein